MHVVERAEAIGRDTKGALGVTSGRETPDGMKF